MTPPPAPAIQPGIAIATPRPGIALVTISNEPHGNALNPQMSADLITAWKRLDLDESVRAIVVTATGERAFCAGNDLTGVPPDDDPEWNFGGLNQLAQVRKPVIAAVNGYAVGGGLEVALTCDIRIAAGTASFSLPEPKLGLIASVGGTQRLPRIIGLGRAMHMLLTADTVDAVTALAWGLVTQLTEPDGLLTAAFDIAERINALGPRAIRATKRCASASFDLPFADGRALEVSIAQVLRYAAESVEGRAAFREKRSPVFPPPTLTDPELAVSAGRAAARLAETGSSS